MGLYHSGLEIEHREDKGQDDYVSLVYTAYRNTHWNGNGLTAKDTYTPHTLQFPHLLSEALTNSCQKWSGRRVYTWQSFGVFDTTLISGNKDKIGYFFLFLFLFFSFFYLMCSFQLQLSVWSLLTHSFVLNLIGFHLEIREPKGKKIFPSNQISPPKYNLPFIARNEKKMLNIFFLLLLRSVIDVAKISLSQTEKRNLKKKKAHQRAVCT